MIEFTQLRQVEALERLPDDQVAYLAWLVNTLLQDLSKNYTAITLQLRLAWSEAIPDIDWGNLISSGWPDVLRVGISSRTGIKIDQETRQATIVTIPRTPRILITYDKRIPDDDGEPETESGWEDQEGQIFPVGDLRDEDGKIDVSAVVTWLNDKGSLEPSSDEFEVGGWYSTTYAEETYESGEMVFYSYHLEDFTPEEERLIYEGLKKGSRYF